MKIFKSYYKNIEALVLEYFDHQVTILPGEGGKVASFKKLGHEYLSQEKGDIYKSLTLEGSYIDSECSGLDDMFPTIDPCFNGERMYLDHGEVCRVPYNYEVYENRLFMQVKSPFNDYIFAKNYTLDDFGRLTISYSATNLLDRPLPVIWCAHLMLKAKDQESIILPKGSYESKMMFSTKDDNKDFFVKNGDSFLASDFSKNDSYKFYIKQKIHSVIKYGDICVETKDAPYLGIWINNGEFKNMKNVAIEVGTGAYDTPRNAYAHGQDVYIEPRKQRTWELKIYTQGGR